MKLLQFLLFFHISIFSIGQTPGHTTYPDLESMLRAKTKAAIGNSFPNFVASNKDGKINNESLKGKVVLINFWFEGCSPCIAEFPALNELAEKLSSNKDFRFISFTWNNPETVQRVIKQYHLRFPVFSVKDDECMRLNQGCGYPTSILLDKQGKIKYLVAGGITPGKPRDFVMKTLLPAIEKEL